MRVRTRPCTRIAWLIAAITLVTAEGLCTAAVLRQVPFSQGGTVVEKLTRSYTRSAANRDLFRGLAGVGSFTYFDPDTDERVSVVLGLDEQWHRLVYTTSFSGETRVWDFGGYGSGPMNMRFPSDLAVASSGTVFIADTGNGRVKVLGWIADYDGTSGAERYFFHLFDIPGGSDFTSPDMVAWDDYGTPSATDDVLWVLDRLNSVVVGYHVTYSGYSLYVRLPFKEVFTGASTRRITGMTKARSFTAANEYESYCTNELLLYDAENRCFLRLLIPHTPGSIQSPSTQITVTEVPNSIADAVYSDLATDAWGNILALDQSGCQIYKFNRQLAFVGSYGSRGAGGMGSEKLLEPRSLSFHFEKLSGSSAYGFGRHALVTEQWSDVSGVQGVEASLSVNQPEVAFQPGSPSVSISISTSDDAHLRLRVLNSVNGSEIRTVAIQDVGAGMTEFVWDGRNNAGALVGRCVQYVVEARAIGFYSQPETVLVTTPVYYKPPMLMTVTVNANVPSSTIRWNGVNRVLNGNSIALPCSVCATNTLGAPPTQVVAGTRYCFDGWSNNLPRNHSLLLGEDYSITLNLTSGSGPTTIQPGATLYDDLYDCRSPYLFQGSATLTTSALGDTIRTWGNVSLRFPKSVAAGLTVRRPLKAKGVRFETVDGASNPNTNLWKGIRLGQWGSLLLDSCFVRNAEWGITYVHACSTVDFVSVKRSSFDYNGAGDIDVRFDHSRSPVAELIENAFHSPGVAIEVLGPSLVPVGTAMIKNNFFYSLSPSGANLSIMGAWQGQVAPGNNFTVNQSNGRGIFLRRQLGGNCSVNGGAYGSPSVAINGNEFAVAKGSGRLALETAKGPTLHINATCNKWGEYTSVSDIDQVIKDDTNDTTLADAIYVPFVIPSGCYGGGGGNGGGGGGGGCPFVLTETPEGFKVENSILGRSELRGSGPAFVSDAYPLRFATPSSEGRIRLRVAELERDTDELDYVGVGAVVVPDGRELGTDASGRPVLFDRGGAATLKEAVWSGKGAPFVSPVGPTSAYQGEPGDSIEFSVNNEPTVLGRKRIGLNMIPKPPEEAAPLPGTPIGVTIRVSPDDHGERWATLDRVVPREYWSDLLFALDALEGQPVRRVRLVWHTRHTLGWAGLVSSEDAPITVLPLVSAKHSEGGGVERDVAERDGRHTTLEPGEHIELEFDAREAPPGARFVLLSHGRYYRNGAPSTTQVPQKFYLGQNRPNPFNPFTQIEFELPHASHVSIRIYDVTGRLVRTVMNASLPAGFHKATWDGRGERGALAASGVYFYEMKAGAFTDRRRMVMIR
jgi:FlgD Ig-like domain/NHL repeat